jgi:hypothetical protein
MSTSGLAPCSRCYARAGRQNHMADYWSRLDFGVRDGGYVPFAGANIYSSRQALTVANGYRRKEVSDVGVKYPVHLSCYLWPAIRRLQPLRYLD